MVVMMAAKKRASRRSKARAGGPKNRVSGEEVANRQEGIPEFEAGEEPKLIDISSPSGQAGYSFGQGPPTEQQAAIGDEATFVFEDRERLITTFTAGGVVLSFGLSFGSVMIIPAWPAGAGLLATLGVISCIGAFMARESI
jgi:hypothetical protein